MSGFAISILLLIGNYSFFSQPVLPPLSCPTGWHEVTLTIDPTAFHAPEIYWSVTPPIIGRSFKGDFLTGEIVPLHGVVFISNWGWSGGPGDLNIRAFEPLVCMRDFGEYLIEAVVLHDGGSNIYSFWLQPYYRKLNVSVDRQRFINSDEHRDVQIRIEEVVKSNNELR